MVLAGAIVGYDVIPRHPELPSPFGANIGKERTGKFFGKQQVLRIFIEGWLGGLYFPRAAGEHGKYNPPRQDPETTELR